MFCLLLSSLILFITMTKSTRLSCFRSNYPKSKGTSKPHRHTSPKSKYCNNCSLHQFPKNFNTTFDMCNKCISDLPTCRCKLIHDSGAVTAGITCMNCHEPKCCPNHSQLTDFGIYCDDCIFANHFAAKSKEEKCVYDRCVCTSNKSMIVPPSQYDKALTCRGCNIGGCCPFHYKTTRRYNLPLCTNCFLESQKIRNHSQELGSPDKDFSKHLDMIEQASLDLAHILRSSIYQDHNHTEVNDGDTIRNYDEDGFECCYHPSVEPYYDGPTPAEEQARLDLKKLCHNHYSLVC